jgi:hypothetical protein
MATSTTIADTTPEKGRLDQISRHNWTATGLAFITTIGFFVLIGVLLLVSWAGGGSPAPVGGTTTAAGAALPLPRPAKYRSRNRQYGMGDYSRLLFWFQHWFETEG